MSKQTFRKSRMETSPLALAVGERIRQLRTARGLTGAALAAELGAQRTMVVAWETGRVVPHVQSIIDLARVLECSADALLPSREAGRAALFARVEALSDDALHDLDAVLNIVERAHRRA